MAELIALPGGLSVPEHRMREIITIYALRDGRVMVAAMRAEDVAAMLGLLEMAKQQLIDTLKAGAGPPEGKESGPHLITVPANTPATEV